MIAQFLTWIPGIVAFLAASGLLGYVLAFEALRWGDHRCACLAARTFLMSIATASALTVTQVLTQPGFPAIAMAMGALELFVWMWGFPLVDDILLQAAILKHRPR